MPLRPGKLCVRRPESHWPDGTSAIASVLTQHMFRLQIWNCCVPMAPAVGTVSPGLPRPTLKVSLLLPQSAVWAPGPTPDPAQSPADEFATQNYPSLSGPARRPPPTSYSRLIQMLLCPHHGVLLLWCPRLGRQSWPGHRGHVPLLRHVTGVR